MIAWGRGMKLGAVGVVLAMSAAVAWFTHHHSVQSVLEQQQQQNIALARATVGAVLPRFAAVLSVPQDMPPNELRDRAEVLGLHAAMAELLRATDIVKLDIYTPGGVTVYSTDLTQIGKSERSDDDFQRALLGETPSTLTHQDHVTVLDKRLNHVDLLSTYVPHRGVDKGSSAVLEVTANITAPLAAARQHAWTVLAVFGVAFAALIGLGMALLRVVGETQRKVEREAGERRVRHQAYHDAMTGLPNRANFLEYLGEAVSRGQRSQTSLAVFMIDVDRFKLVNETFGHKVGDRLLRRVARRVKAVMPREEKLFRVGGDEFAFVLSGENPARQAAELAQRILSALTGNFQINDRAISVVVSIGVTVFPNDAPDVAALVRHADAALARAKAEGGNRAVFFTGQMSESAGRQLDLEAGLRQALKDGEFEIYYQPRYGAVDGRVVGLEALLRWRSSAGGKFIAPDEFVPVLEDTGLIVPVGRWVLQCAVRQAQQWHAKGLGRVRVSVNVSPRQFHNDDFVETVRMALRVSDLAPQYLELELTERLLCEDIEQAVAKMQALKRLGVVLSIDDFGTGYSSLSYLQRFPIDFLKIDKSFVRGITKGKREAAIALAIIDMGHNLQIGLVAEGVEYEEQAAILRERGCHELQGFLYSRPLSATQVELRLQAANGRPGTDATAADLASRAIAAAAAPAVEAAKRTSTPAAFVATEFGESKG